MPKLSSAILPVRCLLIGYPGSGKTGSLASLANAGYRLRIISLDGNIDPLRQFVAPENFGNVDYVVLKEKLRSGPKRVMVAGVPKVFDAALRLAENFKYTDETTGEVVDYGPTREWGLRDVLVIDPLTLLGVAALRRQLALANRQDKNPRKNDWGAAQGDQEGAIEIMNTYPCNLIVTAHLKLIGPQGEEESDSEAVKRSKEKLAQIVPFRLFPSALGRALPPVIGQHFPLTVLAEAEGGMVPKRYLVTQPRDDVDVKVPLPKIDKRLPLESGMLTIFQAFHGKELPDG